MKDEDQKGPGFILHPSSFILRLRRMLRGEVSLRTVILEIKRRAGVRQVQRHERLRAAQLNQQPARLGPEFARLSPTELLAHFRARTSPQFFPGFADAQRTAELQQDLFPDESAQLINRARRIAGEHRWTLLGLDEKCFGAGEIDWHLDPLSNADWPLTYHADINLTRNDGSDVRVVWELNRLAHLITLGRVYAISGDEGLSAEFFRQVTSWRTQNPVGHGVNWSCAMEVALRAMNLLGAFTLFLDSAQMNEQTLTELLTMFDQHGAHIQRNLEYSHIATSNHYLSDITGLLWLGLMLPELEAAAEWRELGRRELLSEMDKQILSDGADYEAATGYHRLMLELFLYSFVLCHLNGVAIGEEYWLKLQTMVEYLRAYLRPDGRAPLIGDSDGGQVLPIVRRAGNDHAYAAGLGAAVFQEPRFKVEDSPASEELLWILGEQGIRDYEALPEAGPVQSRAFPDAGTYILRQDDLYLLFNASGSGVNGRGSHGHNDALGIEVSAGGTAFIVDPGTCVYTADLKERQRFRSTAYHSTVEVDGVEQNTTEEQIPFVIGNEAEPRVIDWQSGPETDVVIAEHGGYQRLPQPLTHRRTVRFEKQERFWLVEDRLTGEGKHTLSFRFHFAPGLEVKVHSASIVEALDKTKGARLLICGIDLDSPPQLEARYSSVDYSSKSESVSACWTITTGTPYASRWAIIPIRKDDDEKERLSLLQGLEVC